MKYLRSLRLLQVALWAKKIGVLDEYLATNSMQRLFASFTRTLTVSDEDDAGLLFYSMQGLEAFYCQGAGGLQKQLAVKCSLFLNFEESLKKRLNALYEFRSGFVHGNGNYTHFLRDGFSFEPDGKHAQNILYGAVEFSLVLLLATIQKCVSDQLQSVQFDTTISPVKFGG
jgi:hypothetical protein